MSHRRTRGLTALAAIIVVTWMLGLPTVAEAHVKWFSGFDWSATPKTIPQIITGTFWGMLALSVVCLAGMVLLDARCETWATTERMTKWLDARRPSSLLIMRVAAFATLIVAWQQETLFAPDLPTTDEWLGWMQFVVLLLLAWPAATSVAGVGVGLLWAYGVYQFGLFHMLDYVNILGAAIFLTLRPLSNKFLSEIALPVLYGTVGFALLWVACEKLVYPEWALNVLSQNPVLTLGLDREFFLVGAAFVELSLGFMLLICLFGRSLSVVITLTFFLTTCVFGRVEIIGHTLIHGALIVFLFEGHGRTFTPPAYFHRTIPLRVAFAGVNFVVVLFVSLTAYTFAAERIQSPPMKHPLVNVDVATSPVPTVTLSVNPDPMSGWNVHITPKNFRFAPDEVGTGNATDRGHAHLYVDDRKIARVYSEWFHIPKLSPGEHIVRVTLNTNSHSEVRHCWEADRG